jgi:hypothetical protein
MDPETDIQAELEQFCDDMFGPANRQMLAYFTLLEDLFCNHLNRRTEQKLFRWSRQFTDWTREELALLSRARELLDEATGSVQPDSDEAERIELFRKTFRLTEKLVAIGNAEEVDAVMVKDVRDYFGEVIIPDPMTIHARGERTELNRLVLDPVLRQIAGDTLHQRIAP